MVISPIHCSAGSACSSGQAWRSSAAAKPPLLGSGRSFTCRNTRGLAPSSAAMRATRWARATESIECTQANCLSTGRTLLACRRPMKCQSSPGRSNNSSCLALASCKRLSPKLRWPRATSSRIASAGWPLLTASSWVAGGNWARMASRRSAADSGTANDQIKVLSNSCRQRACTSPPSRRARARFCSAR